MQVDILKPCGYCYGVIHAINQAKEIKQNNPLKRVVVFGLLVHNHTVTKELEELGIETLDLTNKNPLEELEKFNQDDVVIFSAHGHPSSYEDILNKKGVVFFNLTCFKVQQTFELIKEAKEVIYIGKNGHPEANAALTMNSNIHFYDIDRSFDYKSVSSKDSLIINQTTLSFLELKSIHQEIRERLPYAILTNEICDATYLRQRALENLDDSYDGIIVIGSKTSSNTSKLYSLAKHYHPNKTILFVESKDEIKDLSLNKVVLVSGTSTPPKIIKDIEDFLKGGN